MEALEAQLRLHGTIVVIAGLACGLGFARAILAGRGPEAERAWRVAHLSLLLVGLTMWVVSLLIAAISPSLLLAHVIVWSFVASGYGLLFVLPYGAVAGHRGLSAAGPVGNRVVLAGNLMGAVGSLVGTLALFVAILRSL